jgi:translation initiation factor IF-1
VVEDLNNGQIRVQCDDGTVRVRLPEVKGDL